MLSILIPVFNYRMEPLVSELIEQCTLLNLSFEIILLDDGSKAEFKAANKALPQQFEAVRYLENSKNEGRSVSRNKLMHEAKGDWLWFLDCDGRAHLNNSLVESFWQQKEEKTLVSGGRIYASEPPADKSKYLHWLWGSTRELIDSEKRMTDPVTNFLSNNFLVSRQLMEAVQFSTALNGYGYEDTLFAAHCLEGGFDIKHIENPVLHEGLESTEDFIAKIEESLHNMVRLDNMFKNHNKEIPLNSRLYRFYKKTRRIPKFVIVPFAQISASILKKRLQNGMLNLFWFDVYRLCYAICLPHK
ncbi:MAG: glycosyltransferase family 2 protein [Bacteroidia bacterium]|jgi:glycosyltransferase involved in cell wall biosynthesis